MRDVIITKQPNIIVVEIDGKSLKDVYVLATKTLAAILEGDEENLATNATGEGFGQTLSVAAVDQASLMVEWLTALISLADVDSIIIDQVSIDSLDETSLTASVRGYYRPQIAQPINSVIYDSVKIKKNDWGFKAYYHLEI